MTTPAEGQLIALDEARARLAKVATVDEAKGIRDKAEALRHYAKQQGLGLEAQNKAAEIKIRAERRAGEILSEVERQDHKPVRTTRHAGESKPTYTETIREAEIPETTARRWQAEASIPEPVFELFAAQTKDKGEELTSAAVQRLAATVETKPERERKKEVAALPSVRWARQMRALSFAVQSFIEIARHIKQRERELLRADIARCISELRAAEKELA